MHHEVVCDTRLYWEDHSADYLLSILQKSFTLNFCAFYGFQGAGVSLPGVQLLMKVGKTQGAF